MDFDIGFNCWFPDFPDPDNVLFALIASREGGGLFAHNYKNERIDQLLKDGIKTEDVEERLAIYDELQQVWFEDLPTIPLMESFRYVIYRSYVKGFTQDAIVFTEVRQSFANAYLEK